MSMRDKIMEPAAVKPPSRLQLSLAAVARRRSEASRKAALRHGVHLALSHQLRDDATPRGANEIEFAPQPEIDSGESSSSSGSGIVSRAVQLTRNSSPASSPPKRFEMNHLRIPAEIALLTEQPKAQSAPPALDRGSGGHLPATLPPRCPTCHTNQSVVPFRSATLWYCFGDSRTGKWSVCGEVWSDRLPVISRWCKVCAHLLDAEQHYGEFGYACRKCKRFHPFHDQKHVELTKTKPVSAPKKSPYYTTKFGAHDSDDDKK